LLGAATKQYVDNAVAIGLTIPDGSITTPKLANLAVTTGKLDDGSVTTIKIANNAVDGTKIPDLALTTNKIADNQITYAKLGTVEKTRVAKAWVNFNGTTSPGTIRSQFNVSSVTKNGTGDYTINFATALADANYSVSLTTLSLSATDCARTVVVKGVATTGPSNKTTSAISILSGITSSGVMADLADINCTIFGN
jgi:hypothetical protein